MNIPFNERKVNKMLFIIILLVATMFVQFSMFVGAMSLLCFKKEDLVKIRGIKKGDVPIIEYLAVRYTLACVNFIMCTFADHLRKEA